MKAVVDTNVLAYFLLGTRPFVDEASRFWHALDDALAPAVWLGAWAGRKILQRINQKLFENLALGLAALAAVKLLLF